MFGNFRIPKCFCLGILVLVMIFLGNSRIPTEFCPGILEFLRKIIANSRIPRQKHLGILDFAKPKHRLFAKKLGVIFAQVFYHS